MLMELLLKREQRISATEEEEVDGPVVYPVLAVPTDRWQGRLLATLESSICGLLSTQTNVQLLLLLLLLLVDSAIKSLWIYDCSKSSRSDQINSESPQSAHRQFCIKSHKQQEHLNFSSFKSD